MATIDFGKIVAFANGERVLNCTPHTITFRDGDTDVVVEPCGAKVNARAVETPVAQHGEAVFVKTVFQQTDEGCAELAEIINAEPTVIIVGSIISAQAYPGQVLAMTPAVGFERVPPEQKRMSTSKFTIF